MNNIVIFFVIQLILIYFLALIAYYFLLLKRKVAISNRLDHYVIIKQEKEIRFFDKVFMYYDKLINFVSKFLYKIKIFNTYSLKYQKYIKKEDKLIINKMDFVSKKILLAFLFLSILLIIKIYKFESVTIIESLFTFLFGFFTVDLFLISKSKILKKERENDLLKAITIMNNAFKSGHSIMQAIHLVSCELDTPLGMEFKKMYIDLTYGLTLNTVFKRFEKRVNIDDVKYITTSLNILNQTGGDIVKVFQEVEKTFFNNKKLKDELNNLTASSKMLYYMLSFIPIIFILIIFLLDSTYFIPFFNNILGIIILLIIIVLYISYILLIKKIMKVGEHYE